MKKSAEATVVRKPRNFSFIWLIPLVTALIGLVVFIDYQLSRGPMITLIFDQAEEITPGRTELKAMDVKVGLIKTVELSKDSRSIIATAQMDKTADQIICEDTQFWVIKPRITRDGISGLSTLLSGAYVNVQPGIKKSDTRKKKFKVLKTPPVAGPDVKGLRIMLVHNQMGKLDVGDPVYFKGFTVGRVESMRLDVPSQKVVYKLFVYAPYDVLIHENTHFWLSKPFDLNISESGIHLQLGSLDNLLLGGVTFDFVEQLPPGKKVTQNNKKFVLYSSARQVQERYFGQFTRFVMFFNESIRGLQPMAAVEYMGIRIGSVLQVPFNFHDPLTYPERPIPILVSIDLGNLNKEALDNNPKVSQERMQTLYQQGLVATLHPSNLITGQLVVDLSFQEKKGNFKNDRYQGYLVFPTKLSSFTQLQKEISMFVGSLKKISADGSFKKIDKAVEGFNRFLTTGSRVMKDLDAILKAPGARELPDSLNVLLNNLHQILQSFSPDTSEFNNLQDGLLHLDDVMIQLAPLLERLNQKPDALIFGGAAASDPVPRGQSK